MELHFLQPLLHTLHSHQQEAGLIAAAIAFVESLAVIGSFIPGSITLGAVGTLIGSATIPALSTIIYISLGAFIGDFISYGIGRHYQDRIHRIWPFTRYPKLLEKSRFYCQKHGGISILIGRFTGPMRSFVPMITGMMKMPVWRFVSAALPSAFAWVITFLAPGILLGALSQEIPARVATEFVLIGLALIVVVWFLGWCLLEFFEQLSDAIHDLCQSLWAILRGHAITRRFTQLIACPTQPDNPRQLLRLLIVLLNLILFSLIALFVCSPTLNFPIDLPFYHLAQSLRTTSLQPIMVIISMLGKFYTLALASLLIVVWLLIKKYYRYAYHTLLTLLLAMASIACCKYFLFHPRPGQTLFGLIMSGSFPSGHTTLSMALFGLWGTWLRLLDSSRRRWIAYSISIGAITLIALSRLYLGMHWVSDIAGGLFLGLIWMHVALLSFFRHPPKHHPSVRAFSTVIVISVLIAWSVYGTLRYQHTMQQTAPITTHSQIDLSAWWQGQTLNNLPSVRLNRLGKPDHAFNIQWMGTQTTMVKVLTQGGWTLHPVPHNLPGAIQRLSTAAPLPLLPKLYNNKAPDLVFTRGKKTLLILRLWRTTIHIKNHNTPLWLGTLGALQAGHHIFNIYPYEEDQYQASQLQVLQKNLQRSPFVWKLKTAPRDIMAPTLHWDYRIIRIKPRNVQP